MNRLPVIFVIYYLLSATCYAQPSLEWVQTYSNTVGFTAGSYALVLDDSGNVFITGFYQNNSSTLNSYCTIKYSTSGVQQWVANYYSNNDGGRYSYDIAIDKFSNVYVTGYSFETGRHFDYCTIKYNSNGVQQWIKHYNGPINGEDEAKKIAVDNGGNVYVSGYSATICSGCFAYTTIKYSSDGNELWVRTYPLISSLTDINGIKVDDNCNIYITGGFGTKAVTVKYDSSGTQLWAHEYSGYGTSTTEALGITLDDINNVYIAGYTNQSKSFTIKYSATGTLLWERKYNPDSATGGSYNTKSVVVDTLGNVYASGSCQSNQSSSRKLCVIKYSSLGETLWVQRDTASLGSMNSNMVIDKNNNIYVTESTSEPGPNRAITILKYSTLGAMLWRQRYFTSGVLEPWALKIDSSYNVFLTGRSNTKMLTLKYSQSLIGINNTNNETPKGFKLNQNHPNPFNPATKIQYQIPKNSNVTLVVYDILGIEVTKLVNQNLEAGTYEIYWDASNYSSGIYFYKLFADEFIESKKMILIK